MKKPDDLRNLILDVTGHDIGPSPVQGEKGSSKTGGSSGGTTAPDTLFSTATVRIVDLLSEGDIKGLANGLQSIFLNDVPVQNPDGSANFKGFTVDSRVGFPDQTYMEGYPDVETTQNIGTKVTNQGPVSASITEPAANRARVTIQFPSLFLAKNDGSVSNNSVSYRVNVKSNGGPWVNAVGDQTLSGKTSSGYFRSHEFALPSGSAPWTIQVVRISADTDGFNASQQKYTNQSDIIYYSLTTLIDSKFSYPNSAVFGITAQASSFGSSVPVRKYLIDGIAMAIPTNYDPVARTYSGIWDGTFKRAYQCNNPAWVMYALMTDARFGLGDYISDGVIDKWSLYDIGRYCDELVPDGVGGQEPRSVFNGVIETQQEAYELLQLIAQVFRGMVFWSSGAVTAAQDRPRTPKILVTEANVVEGLFTYSSSSFKARHTVAVVKFSDPNNLYKTDYEVVEDEAGIARYGYNPTRIDLLGCTSRGQARRAGKWILLTELQQTQALSYKAGLDHAVLRPGDVVAVQDPSIVALDDSGNLSGRLLAGSTASTAVLDHPVILDGTQYYIEATMPDGTVQSSPISQGAGTYSTLSLQQPFTVTPDPGAVWIVYGNIQPRLFSITGIHEEEPHIYAVSALEYQPSKYGAVDVDAKFQPTNFSALGNVVPPPTNLAVREGTYTELGQPKQSLTLSWTPGNPFNVIGYYVTAIRPSGAVINLPRTVSVSVDFAEVDSGPWTFLVTTVGLNGNPSVAASLTYNVKGWNNADPTIVQNLQVRGGGANFYAQSCTMTWTNAIPATVSPYPVVNVVQVFDVSTNALLHYEVLPPGVTQWTYDYQVNRNEGGPRRSFRVSVCARYATGADGPYTSLAVTNPPPAKINPACTATTEVVFVNFNDAKDDDWRGYLCWISTTKGFNPLTTPVTADTVTDFLTFKMASNTNYYVRAAAYDSFGKTPQELNISDEVQVTTTINQFDPTAPNIPATPALTTAIEIAPDGTATAVVKATWAQDTSTVFGVYDVQWAQHDAGTAEQDKGYVGDGATSSKWEHHGFTPGKSVSVKVRAISANGFAKGGFSPVATIVAAANTTPPNPVTGLKAAGAFQNGFVSWSGSTSRDLDHYEVWAADGNVSSANPPASATLLANVAAFATTFTDSTLSVTGTRTYWVRPVNTSGTLGSYTGPVVATSAQIQQGQLAAGVVDATKLATGLTAPTVVPSLPTGYVSPLVFNNADGKLYRWTGSAYTSAVPAADVTGQLTNAQISGLDAAKLTTQIQRTNIAPNAVDTPQLNAGAVTTNVLSAGAVTTSRLAIGSINRMPCGDFSQGTFGVAFGYNTTGVTQDAPYARTDYAPAGMRSMHGHLNGTAKPANGQLFGLLFAAFDSAGNFQRIPVLPSQTFEASAFVSVHRCSATLYLEFFDSNGNLLSAPQAATIGANYSNGGPTSQFPRLSVIGTAPANTVSAQIEVRAICNGSDTDPYIFPSGIMLASCASTQTEASPYVDPTITSINGGNLVTGTVTARTINATDVFGDRGVFNSLSAGIASFGGLTAAQIAAGAISTDKLAVGLSTGNLVWGSDLLGVPNAAIGTYNNIPSPTGYYAGLNASGAQWQPTGMGSIQVSCSGSPGSASTNYAMDGSIYAPTLSGGFDPWLPGQANQRYEFSSFVSCHRCAAFAVVAFSNDDGSKYQETGGTSSPYDNEVSGSLTSWFRSTGFAVAPSWTTRVRIWSRAILSGGSNPYLFTTGFYLAIAGVNQTQPSPYAIQSRTVINGGQVATNSLNANVITSGTITTDRFTSNTIDASIITTTSFKSSVVNTGLLTADSILVGNGNLSSLFGGSNSTKINGGAISANSITAAQLYIGQRGVVFTNVEFWQERDGNGNITGRLNWTAGQVNWKDAANNAQAVSVAGGSVGRGSDGWQTVWWNITQPGVLQSSAGNNVINVQNDTNCILCATSADATGVAVYFGGSRLDGSKLTALSIVAGSIAAGAIQTQHMGANTIQGDRIAAQSLVADKLTSGTLTAGTIYVGTNRFLLQGDPNTPLLRIFAAYPMDNGSGNYAEVISMGRITPWTGDGYDYGLIIRDNANNEVLRACRSGTYIQGAYIAQATIGRAQIGSLAVDNLRIAGQAVSQCAAASSGNQAVTVAITLRGSGNVLVQAFRRGGGGNQYQQGVDGGALRVLVSSDNQNFAQLDAVTNNFSFLWDPNAKGSYKFMGSTSLSVVDPGRGAGVWYYQVQDTNGAGVGGVVIQVTELSK